jgi:hypothetical protein
MQDASAMDATNQTARHRWSITLREIFLFLTICCLAVGWYAEHRERAQIKEQFSSILEGIENVKSGESPGDSWGGAIVTNVFICEWSVRERNSPDEKQLDLQARPSDARGNPQ